ncbi:MAG: hypothetical protein WBB28_11335 [Crinalium sp.]
MRSRSDSEGVSLFQLPVTSYQLPVTSYQLPVTSYKINTYW